MLKGNSMILQINVCLQVLGSTTVYVKKLYDAFFASDKYLQVIQSVSVAGKIKNVWSLLDLCSPLLNSALGSRLP